MPAKGSVTRRVMAMLMRYLYLHQRSVVRSFDIVFWPVIDLLVFSFLVLYLQQAASGPLATVVIFIIGALISWNLHYRGQQALTLSLLGEIYMRNLINLLISPLRFWEWLAACGLYGLLKVTAITILLSGLAYGLHAFAIWEIGWAFIPMAITLLWFGWSLGVFTSGLLIRYGLAAEAMIWGVPFLVQPFSCVLYPVESLPGWAQAIAKALPTSYAFEGLRAALQQQSIPLQLWLAAIGLNILYLVLGVGFFAWCIRDAQTTGQLGRLGQR